MRKKTGRRFSNYELTLNCNTAPPAIDDIKYREDSDEYEVILPKNAGKHKDLSKVVFLLSSDFGVEKNVAFELPIVDESIQGKKYTFSVKKSNGGHLVAPSGQRHIKAIVYDKAGIKSAPKEQKTEKYFNNLTLIPQEITVSKSVAEKDGIKTPKIIELASFFEGEDWKKANYKIKYEADGFNYNDDKKVLIKEKRIENGRYEVSVSLDQGGGHVASGKYYVKITDRTYSIDWPSNASGAVIKAIKVGPPDIEITDDPFDVEGGTVIRFEAHVNDEYEIEHWLLDGSTYTLDAQPSPPAKIESTTYGQKLTITVSKDHIIGISLKKNPEKTHKIEWSIEGGDNLGSLLVKKSDDDTPLAAPYNAKHGSNLEFKATPNNQNPNDKRKIKKWIVDEVAYTITSPSLPQGITIEETSGVQTLKISNITKPYNVKVEFREHYSLSFSLVKKDVSDPNSADPIPNNIFTTVFRKDDSTGKELARTQDSSYVLKDIEKGTKVYVESTTTNIKYKGGEWKSKKTADVVWSALDGASETSCIITMDFNRDLRLFKKLMVPVSISLKFPEGETKEHNYIVKASDKDGGAGNVVSSSLENQYSVAYGTKVVFEVKLKEGISASHYNVKEWKIKRGGGSWSDLSIYEGDKNKASAKITELTNVEVKLEGKYIYFKMEGDAIGATKFKVSKDGNEFALTGDNNDKKLLVTGDDTYTVEVIDLPNTSTIVGWKHGSDFIDGAKGANGKWNSMIGAIALPVGHVIKVYIAKVYSLSLDVKNYQGDYKISITKDVTDTDHKHVIYPLNGGKIEIDKNSGDNARKVFITKGTKIHIKFECNNNEYKFLRWVHKSDSSVLEDDKWNTKPAGTSSWNNAQGEKDITSYPFNPLTMVKPSTGGESKIDALFEKIKCVYFEIKNGADSNDIGEPKLKVYQGSTGLGEATKDKVLKVPFQGTGNKNYKLVAELDQKNGRVTRVVGWKKNGELYTESAQNGVYKDIINSISLKADDRVTLYIGNFYPLILDVADYDENYKIKITRDDVEHNNFEHVTHPYIKKGKSRTINKNTPLRDRKLLVTQKTQLTIELMDIDDSLLSWRWVFKKDDKSVKNDKWNNQNGSETWNNSKGELVVSSYQYSKEEMADDGKNGEINAKFKKGARVKSRLLIEKDSSSVKGINPGDVEIELRIYINNKVLEYERLGKSFLSVDIEIPAGARFQLRIKDIKEGNCKFVEWVFIDSDGTETVVSDEGDDHHTGTSNVSSWDTIDPNAHHVMKAIFRWE